MGPHLDACAATLDVAAWHVVRDDDAGLLALIILDNLTLGPAAGGVRTRSFASHAAAVSECAGLARAMTFKCAIAGLDAGGGKTVVLDHPGLDRARGFAALGRAVEELEGRYLTAGDLGTNAADLAAMAEWTRHVRTDEGHLGAAVARGLVRCLEACVLDRQGAAATPGRDISLQGLQVAIQGCGAMGEAAARALHSRGCNLLLADLDGERARELASELGAQIVPAETILATPCDVLAPCATGGVIDDETARSVAAFAVCGAANNIVADADAERRLMERGVLFVPDALSSSGAVIEGVGDTLMGLEHREHLINNLRHKTLDVLQRARASGRLASQVVTELATARIHAAEGSPR